MLELYDLETHQKKLGPDYPRLKTMVKRSIEQNLRNRNFGARSGNYERNAVVKNQESKENVGSEKPKGSVLKETVAVSATMLISVQKMTQPNPSPSLQQNERKSSKIRSPRGKGPSGRMFRWPCKDYLKGTCTESFCQKWHPPECLFCKSESGCKLGEKCSYAHRQVDEQHSKRSKKNDDKSAVAMLKRNEQPQRTGRLVMNAYSSNTRQLGCVFHDMEPPKSSSILRKSPNVRKPIRCVKFSKAVVRHAGIRDQNPSLGMICPGNPHQRSPNAPTFEDRSQEETEWQERCAREAAWKLAKIIQKLKRER